MKEKDLASTIIARQFWIIVILIVALVGTNIGWLLYESQFETVSSQVEQNIESSTDSNISQSGIGY